MGGELILSEHDRGQADREQHGSPSRQLGSSGSATNSARPRSGSTTSGTCTPSGYDVDGKSIR